MADETILFEIVTPAKLTLSEQVAMVVLPGSDGQFGVLPQHAPLLSSLRAGVAELYDSENRITKRIFIEEGFADVTPECCTVLTEQATAVTDITREMADQRLKKATDELLSADTPSVQQSADREVRVAEAMLEAVDTAARASAGGH